MDTIAFLVAVLATLAVYNVSASKGCEQLKISVVKRISKLHTRSIEFSFEGRIDFHIQPLPYIKFQFEPPLIRGDDYEVDYFISENSLPRHHKTRRNFNETSIGVLLKPGKSWIKNNVSAVKPSDLYLVDAIKCASKRDVATYKSESALHVKVGSFTSKPFTCPTLPQLPDAQPELSAIIATTLKECANLRILKSKKLNSHRMSSFNFLSPNLVFLLVDASDQPLEAASLAVDTFLGPHSVLQVVWEPYSDTDPKWFVLMPHPVGMPGHLFALLDTLQWEHPLVNSHKGVLEPQCNSTHAQNHDQNCVMGCPGTFLARLTGLFSLV